MLQRYNSPITGFELSTLVMIGTDCTCSCKPNDHTMTSTTTPNVLDLYIICETDIQWKQLFVQQMQMWEKHHVCGWFVWFIFLDGCVVFFVFCWSSFCVLCPMVSVYHACTHSWLHLRVSLTFNYGAWAIYILVLYWFSTVYYTNSIISIERP